MDPALVEESKITNITNGNEQNQRIHEMKECLVSVFEIGLMCSVDMARERMHISDVVSELHYIKHVILELESTEPNL